MNVGETGKIMIRSNKKARVFLNHSEEKGIALLMALGCMAIAAVVTLSLISYSRLSSRLAHLNSNSLRNRYLAESALSRAAWLIKSDMVKFRSRSLGGASSPGLEEEELERWMADGKIHELEMSSLPVTVQIFDANKGLSLAGMISDYKRKKLEEKLHPDKTEDIDDAVQSFLDALQDYTDRDDEHRLNGMEKDFYLDEFDADLPRNNEMKFIEEALWIPGIKEAFYSDTDSETAEAKERSAEASLNILDRLRVIPPSKSYRYRTTNPSFFSSPVSYIATVARLSEEEAEIVEEALKAWFEEKVPVAETLGPVHSKIKRYFSFKESNVYTFVINCRNKSGAFPSAIHATVDLEKSFKNPNNKPGFCFNYWQKVLY